MIRNNGYAKWRILHLSKYISKYDGLDWCPLFLYLLTIQVIFSNSIYVMPIFVNSIYSPHYSLLFSFFHLFSLFFIFQVFHIRKLLNVPHSLNLKPHSGCEERNHDFTEGEYNCRKRYIQRRSESVDFLGEVFIPNKYIFPIKMGLRRPSKSLNPTLELNDTLNTVVY